MSQSMRFSGKIVVITGAAQGIGRQVAEQMAAEGARLALIDRADYVNDVALELRAAGAEAFTQLADMENWTESERAIAGVYRHYGRIDVLINNVGGTIWARPYAHYQPEQIEAEIRRSLFPTLWGCRAVLPLMVEQRSGAIVNVSSVATRGVNRAPYAAAKGGINALTRTLALEYTQYGIRINATAPGGTDAPPRLTPRNAETATQQEQAWYQQVIDQTVNSSLMHRYGTLKEQANAILFLASDDASYITGSVLPVAGGDEG